MNIGGIWGKILHVNLTNGENWVEEPDPDLYLKLVGGRALVAYLLLRDLPAGVDPLGPENLLIFAPGIFQGSNLPGSGRHGVGAKSPLTGLLGSSEAGGWWGDEFKRTGFDALVIHGQAEKPVYVWIRNGQIEIRSAQHLWSKDTAQVQSLIQTELGDKRIRVAQCGIAGENLVLCAAIMNDINRAAGRTGLGAVMGSKRLKAVAVRGTLKLPMVNRKQVTAIASWDAENYRELSAWLFPMGTPGAINSFNQVSNLPTRNFQDPYFEHAESISGELLHNTLIVDRDTCQVCPITCKQVVEYDNQEYQENPHMRTNFYHKLKIDRAYGGPEYESIGGLGSACGVDDLLAVTKANELCARWGLDTISVGMTVAFLMECVDRGIVTAEQTQGFLPRWGNASDLLLAVEMIAHRRGFGDKMALGSKRLAEIFGKDARTFTVEVKGLELPMHDPRLKHALGVGYAVAPMGADHNANIHDTGYTSPGWSLERVNTVFKVEPLPANDLSNEKMELFYHEVNWQHFQDCAVICMFHPYTYKLLAQALSGITGHNFGLKEILAVGERAQTLSRLFNIREGLTAEDDKLPKRVTKAFKEGPLAGIEITDEAFLKARNHWYYLMGWTETGVPTPERLKELGLAEMLEDIRLR
ncbi:MAG: aldehyde ferredoxin oxidoreductase family protein [Anaerolineae bacterium]